MRHNRYKCIEIDNKKTNTNYVRLLPIPVRTGANEIKIWKIKKSK